MVEASYTPTRWTGWEFTGTIALDRSPLIGNNAGTLLTLRKQGFIKNK
jgi:hypothetical protein